MLLYFRVRDDGRRLDAPLRQAKKLLRSRKQSYEDEKKVYDKKQLILLLTFGVDELLSKFHISHRILKSGIDLIVIGLGNEANNKRQQLECLVKPKDKICEFIKRKSKTRKTKKTVVEVVRETRSKSSAGDTPSKLSSKCTPGKGFSYITNLVEYTVNMLHVAILWSKFSHLTHLFPMHPFLKACCSIKKRLWHRCFPLNFVKFLKTSF